MYFGKIEGVVDFGDVLDYIFDIIWSFEIDVYGKSLIYIKCII